MKKLFLTVLFYSFFFLINEIHYSQANQSPQVGIAVTIYNMNLGVVKDVRNIDIQKGKNEIAIKDVAQRIDPTSVHIKINGEVIEQNYQYDLVNFDKILQKYINKDIQLVKNAEVIEGKLLSNYGGQIVLEKKDGGLLMLPDAGEYRISVGSLPEGLITEPTLLWLINANSSDKQNVEISYQTGGLNWHAEYVAVLNEDDTQLDLNSWVSLENNSGTTYKNAKLKLVAGDVNMVREQVQPRYDQFRIQKEMAATESQFVEKEFFEYHIYDLKRPSTLANNETKQISLFEAEKIKAVKKYLYTSGIRPIYYAQNKQNKVAVVVEFENSEKNNLGVPMPRGKVRVYKSDEKSLEFVGEDLIDHTPKEEKIKLRIGDAFDIIVEEIQTENRRITEKVNEQSYEIKFKNHKKDDVVIEVERYLGNYWEILGSSIEYQKKDAQTVIFKVPVKKEGENVLKFKIRYTY